MIRHLKKLENLLFLFFYLFAPHIFPINTWYILGVIAWVNIFISNRVHKNILKYKHFTGLYFILFLMIIYAIFISVLNGILCKDIIFPALTIAFIMIPCSIVIYKYYDRYYNKSFESLLFDLLLVGNIQGFLGLICLIFPTFRDRYVSYTNGNLAIERMALKYQWMYATRYYGISTSVITFMPVLQAIIIVLTVYYIINEKQHKLIFFLPLLFFSIIINARTAIVLLLIGIVTVYMFSNGHLIKKISLIITCLILSWFIITKMIAINTHLAIWLSNGLSSILSIFDNNKTGIIADLWFNKNNWKLPIGISRFFGIGRYVVVEPYNGFHVDIGYINYIWVGGIPFCIMLVYFYTFIGKRLYEIKNIDNIIFIFLIIFELFSLIFSFKMPIQSTNEMMSIFILLYTFFSLKYIDMR